jgi:hypothetical protein
MSTIATACARLNAELKISIPFKISTAEPVVAQWEKEIRE